MLLKHVSPPRGQICEHSTKFVCNRRFWGFHGHGWYVAFSADCRASLFFRGQSILLRRKPLLKLRLRWLVKISCAGVVFMLVWPQSRHEQKRSRTEAWFGSNCLTAKEGARLAEVTFQNKNWRSRETAHGRTNLDDSCWCSQWRQKKGALFRLR